LTSEQKVVAVILVTARTQRFKHFIGNCLEFHLQIDVLWEIGGNIVIDHEDVFLVAIQEVYVVGWTFSHFNVETARDLLENTVDGFELELEIENIKWVSHCQRFMVIFMKFYSRARKKIAGILL
jgi:hypothetical protein